MGMTDLTAIQQVREQIAQTKKAYQQFSQYSQSQIEKIVAAMALAGKEAAERLARLAAGETGRGRVESKIHKNRFAIEQVYNTIRHSKTTGIIDCQENTQVYTLAQPFGIIAALVPLTSPTATVLFKSLIAVQGGNCVIFAPPQGAVQSVCETVSTMVKAAESAGAPEGILSSISHSDDDVIQELIRHKDVDFILATTTADMLSNVTRSGKPSIGMAWGNTPAYIDRSAQVVHAIRCIVESQMFDFGMVYEAEESLVVDAPLEKAVLAELQKHRAYILSATEIDQISRIVYVQDKLNPEIIGQPACRIAKLAGISISPDTTVLVAPLHEDGSHVSLARPKLAPLLALYVENGWEAGCQRCLSLLALGGEGHTIVVHATDPDVIMEFAVKKPVARILVNAPASQGVIGLATNLTPSLTLGCGTKGGSITTDNISTPDLLNYKRVAAIRANFLLWDQGRTVEPELAKLRLSEKDNPLVPKAMALELPKGPTPKPNNAPWPSPGMPGMKKIVAWNILTYPQPPDPSSLNKQRGWPWKKG